MQVRNTGGRFSLEGQRGAAGFAALLNMSPGEAAARAPAQALAERRIDQAGFRVPDVGETIQIP